MSVDDLKAEIDDPDAHREELIEDLKATREQEEQLHADLLEAAAEGEEFAVEEHETVTIGDLHYTVRTSFTGETGRKIDRVRETASTAAILDTLCDVLADQTVHMETDHGGGTELTEYAAIREHFIRVLDSHDVEKTGEVYFNRLVEQPCELEAQRKQEAVQSFPAQQGGGYVGHPRRRGPRS